VWISVKDSLPDIGKDVLTYDGEYILVEYLLLDEDIFTWSCSDFDDITHWMPLPEPPKVV
jgi:hypothetical protein